MLVALELLFTVISLFQVDSGASLRADPPFRLPCTPKRTQIVRPEIADVTGQGITLKDSLGNPAHDLLYVNLTWRRSKLGLVLHKNDLVGPTAHSEWRSDNETFAELTGQGCFYHGYVKGQRTSYVALSACDGLAGYIQTNEELLFIQSATRDSDDIGTHLVYTCEPKHRLAEPEWRPITDWQTQHSRRRRSADRPKYLEVMVVVDSSLVDEIGSKDKTETYVMTLMNIANTVYQHHTLGVDIRVVVVKIIFLQKSQQKEVLKKLDAFRTVNMFCEWSQTQIPRGQPMDYDISVLITKEELGPSGYAPITGLCNPTRSCAAVRDEGFTTGFIIAHEMAHVFGLFHDGHGNDCHGRKYVTSMMAALVESKLNHFWWSECSSRRMKEMVRYLFCLNNEPKPKANHYSLKAPSTLENKLGQPWSLDFQCRMEFGSYFKLCGAFYNDPCGTLWCSHESQPHLCRTKRGPPMPGSKCGTDRECRNEVCQYVGIMKPVDGMWSEWSKWTECSSECGVGIRQRARLCDNPEPAYDGKQCQGEANEWNTCINNTCSTYEDIRAGECTVWDSLQIRYGTHKWQPFEGLNASSMCQQTCRSFYTNELVTIDVDVADGTPCSYSGNSSNICMAGKCLTVGCDGVINSTKMADVCGVCEGDGSQCKVVQGDFVRKPAAGDVYLLVVTIPAGARHIKIEETQPSAQFLGKITEKRQPNGRCPHDIVDVKSCTGHNVRALQNAKYGTYVLNGDKRQSNNLKLVINGAMFEYKRGDSKYNEMVTSPGPLRGSVQVMLFPNKVMDNTSVHYSYTVHKTDFTLEMTKFKWKFEKWSPCSVTCGHGVQTIMHGCYDKDSEAKVNDESCSMLKPPRKDEVKCVRESCGTVSYNYAMSNDYEECNAKCGQTGIPDAKFYCERFQWLAFETWTECPCGGPGIETRDIYCEKVTYATNGEAPDIVERAKLDMCQGVAGKPESHRSCKGKPCVPKFQWTDSGLLTACSAPCGATGIQEVILECEQITVNNGVEFFEIADDHFCDDIPMPEIDSRICTSPACDDQVETYEWQATEQWTDCNAECDKKGTQARLYQCRKVGQKNSDVGFQDELCEADKKMNETRGCNGPQCPLKWSVEKWSECSATCGKGKQYRKVFCGDPDTDADDFRCSDSPPTTSKFCNKKNCPVSITIEPRDEDCSDKYKFCTVYKALEHRCKRDVFRRKCCRSCINFERSANRPPKTVRQHTQTTTTR